MFNARLSPTPRAAAPHRKMQGAAKQLLVTNDEAGHMVDEQIITRRRRRVHTI
jgi:hypothetical protein